MKINKKATSIVEAMILMMIVVIWTTWMYSIYISSTRLENSIWNKIIAINIAREWIEAMTNIRNTNWILFSSSKKNCWNTLNYNSNCVDTSWTALDIESLWSYILYKDTKNRWNLTKSNYNWDYSSNENFRNEHRVWLDSDWFYTNSWSFYTWTLNTLTPLFTRKIQVNYPEWNSDTQIMEVSSIVEWKDNSSNDVHKIELKKTLTNWEE